MRLSAFFAFSSLLLFATGCPAGGGGIGPLLTNGAEMPDRDPDNTWSGNLSDGELIDLDWGSSGAFACWPGTEELNFTGTHVFDDDALAAGVGDFHVQVNPVSPGTDISMYAIKTGTDGTDYPPELPSAVACDASYDRANDSNPGVAEGVTVQGGQNPYRIIVGVAGANGTTEGEYDVRVWYGD